MGIGLFLENNFKNQPVELMVSHDAEWLSYAESSLLNAMIINCVFIEYDEESNILVLENHHNGTRFYIAESFVEMFWKPGFKIVESIRTMINTGQKLFKDKKNRDIF